MVLNPKDGNAELWNNAKHMTDKKSYCNQN